MLQPDTPAAARRRASIAPLAVGVLSLLHLAWYLTWPGLQGGTFWAWTQLPLDDAWIHLSYAQNLLRHGYFTYNPGTPETGATSPLWAVLLSAALGVLRDPVVAAKGLGALCSAMAVAALFAEVRAQAGRVAAWIAALLLALDPEWAMAAASGMEVALAGLLLVAILSALRQGRPLLLGLLIGLAWLTRPELAVVGAAAWVLMIAQLRRSGVDNRRRPRHALATAGIAFLVALPWLLFCRLGTGQWLANTFYAKSQGLVLDRWRFKVFYDILEHSIWPSPFVHDPVALGLILAGAVTALILAWRRPAAAAWVLFPLVHVVGWGLVTANADNDAHPGEYITFYINRYLVPQYPIVFGLAGIGAAQLWRAIQSAGRRLDTGLAPRGDRLVRRAMVALIVGALAAGNFFGWWVQLGPLWKFGNGYAAVWENLSRYNAAACRNIGELHVRTGHWLAANLPPDAVIATQDAGAIRFFTTQRIIDLEGLNDRRFLAVKREGRPEAREYLRRQGVEYIVAFFPEYDYDIPTELIKTFESRPNQIAVGDQIMILRVLDGGVEH